ncbi:MFS transporter [Amycolatopsis sp. YIM 10]|uniref:MFS transporter n=1 Tax=Amycolatopsis sp. YIM 10 TaxID=2653857 RepID=UPI0012904C37|nr:MFS transporter [Amycolatopsis sp. YIM 10]QFU91570.1 Major Facilitator Superfamily protein [Amycolatopsis sp. YIM 10]
MYIASARETGLEAQPRRGGRRVAGNVFALGAVSLVTDVSSEMVTAVLPLYLVLQLGFSPLQFGILDGLYSGVTAFVRIIGGTLADRWQRRKLMAGLGYGISAVAKLGLLGATGSATSMGLVLAADRTGKGLRTAPRDALISLSSDPGTLGRAFGVHRAMDTVGAFLGPLAAFLLLWAVTGGYRAVFFVSFCVATLGVVLLVLFVRDHRQPAPPRRSVSLRSAFGLLRDKGFRRICGWAAVFGLATVGDAFVYLLLQDRLAIEPAWFAVLPLGTAGVYLLLAVPMGRVADRIGRWRVFVAGHLALLAAYVLLLGAADGLWLVVAGLAAHGLFYACTDGVLMAAAGPLLPAGLRTSGMAVLQTGQALAKLASSVLFGAAWTVWGMRTALVLAVAALAVVVVAALIARPLRAERGVA